MNSNGFLESELITEEVNGQTRVFPVVGGRLRLAHERNETLSLQTEMVSWDGQYAVFKCSAVTTKGQFIGYGTANAHRDERLAESLIELAETRSVARALRFAGYGLEYTGAEEVSHVVAAQLEREQSGTKEPTSVFPEGNGNSKPGAAVQYCAPGNGKEESRPQSFGNGRATTAQVRALYALTKRAKYSDEAVHSLLAPFNAPTFQDLTRESASHLISCLQTEVAA